MGIFSRAWKVVKGGGLHEDDEEARGSWHKSRGVRAEPSENVVPFSSLRSTGDFGQGGRRMIDSPFPMTGAKSGNYGPMPGPSEYSGVGRSVGDLYGSRFDAQDIAVPPMLNAMPPSFSPQDLIDDGEELDPGVLAILQSIIDNPLHASPSVDDFDLGQRESIPNPNANALGSEGLKGRAAAAKETQPDDVKETLEENPNRSLPKKDDESNHEGDE